MDFQRLLITLGIVLLLVGLFWPLISKLGLGRLPGDIAWRKDGFGVYFPITTSIIVSVVITVLIWLFRK